MEAYVLDKDFQLTGVVDMFVSFIWTERYSALGDFELVLPLDSPALQFITKDSYIFINESDRTMVVETIEIETDTEEGNTALIKGSSLESILDRRVVWNWFAGNENLQTSLGRLLTENVIDPAIPSRKIDNFSFVPSTSPEITALNAEPQLFGESVLEVVMKTYCEPNSLGFRLLMPTPGVFMFGLYCGDDRSYSQFANPYVVFSSEFENLVNSKFVSSNKLLKTVSLVGGEGEGSARKKVEVSADGGALSGLNRRETYTDAGNVSSNTEEIPAADYDAQLQQKGREKLAECIDVSVFDGEADAALMYTYGVDYFLGDIVQLENELGFSAPTRVVEYIRTEDSSGIKNYPTFAAI